MKEMYDIFNYWIKKQTTLYLLQEVDLMHRPHMLIAPL